ncbi:endolytic transglycosylase MltG [Paenibacillus sp. 22594]|uniref:endolytic transglycosylase MltG n=1 Tax=Paenibacillus sp. 22594 TaxID=3453947 RepID=UPI003F844BE9
MIKNRSFMLGLGAGLIIGALLLQLMLSGGAAPMTKDELVKEAAKLNLTVNDPAAEAPVEDGADPAQGTEGTAKENDTAAVAGSPKPSASPKASPKASPAASPKAAAKPTDANKPLEPSAPAKPSSSAAVKPKVTSSTVDTPATPAPAVAGTISVKIPTGITLSETADLLAEAGVIDDEAEFLKSANSRKANTRIQYGGYSFTKGESINSIIDKLITVK